MIVLSRQGGESQGPRVGGGRSMEEDITTYCVVYIEKVGSQLPIRAIENLIQIIFWNEMKAETLQ
jgi:hypothetical protein